MPNLGDIAGILGPAFLGGAGRSGRNAATSRLNTRARLREDSAVRKMQELQEQEKQRQEQFNKHLTISTEYLKANRGSDPKADAAMETMGVNALVGLAQVPEAEARTYFSGLKPEVEDAADDFTLSPGSRRFTREGELIASAPTTSKLLSPEELEQKKEIAAAGRTTISVLDKPPSLTQMPNLVGPNGESPEIGETLGELKDKGFRVRSQADQKLSKKASAAAATLDTLDKLANPVFTGKKGAKNRLFDDAVKTWDRIGQTDKDLALYDAFSQGTVASLVRGVGESGNMSNKDIERGLALIPSSGDGIATLPDTREVAQGKMKQLRNWFDTALGTKAPSGKSGKDAVDLSDDDLLKGF